MSDTFNAFTEVWSNGRQNDLTPERFTACIKAKRLSDQQVWDAVVRWHALKSYQRLYTHSLVRREYITQRWNTSTRLTSDDVRVLPRIDLASLFDIADRRHDSNPFTQREQERFHVALTRYWLAMEARRVATAACCERQSQQNRIMGTVLALWINAHDLQESLDVLEVFDFIARFLLQHTDLLAVNRVLKRQRDWDCTHPDEDYERMPAFSSNLWLVLSPADILDLLFWACPPRTGTVRRLAHWSCREKIQYLRQRGHRFRGTVAVQDTDDVARFRFSQWDLKLACRRQVKKLAAGDSTLAMEAWEAYERQHWRKDARGQFHRLPTPLFWGMVLPDEADFSAFPNPLKTGPLLGGC